VGKNRSAAGRNHQAVLLCHFSGLYWQENLQQPLVNERNTIFNALVVREQDGSFQRAVAELPDDIGAEPR
jgi:hypothetical protein